MKLLIDLDRLRNTPSNKLNSFEHDLKIGLLYGGTPQPLADCYWFRKIPTDSQRFGLTGTVLEEDK